MFIAACDYQRLNTEREHGNAEDSFAITVREHSYTRMSTINLWLDTHLLNVQRTNPFQLHSNEPRARFICFLFNAEQPY